MPLIARRSGRCASCTFQIAEWLAPSIGTCEGKGYRSIVRRRQIHSSQLLLRSPGSIVRRQPSTKGGRIQSQIERWHGSGATGSSPDGKYHLFAKLLIEQYTEMIGKLAYRDYHDKLRLTLKGEVACKAWGIHNVKAFETKAESFRLSIIAGVGLANCGTTDIEGNNIFHRLREAFVKGDINGLAAEMRYLFLRLIVEDTVVPSKNQEKIADLRYPTEWFPATRAIQRKIHLHVGPTNSGKTYHALQRLEAAESGIYAGPLRLLAHEIYTRLNAKGKKCALITGEERRIPEGMRHHMSSCTVEMVPLNTRVQVAVIDEIQMVADNERGWAWTQAFLGVQADEVHLCGELRTIDLVTNLCKLMGDELIIHRYERLGPLQMSGSSINGDLKNLQKGDAIILFSRVEIHAMKKKVEQVTGKRCAVVYGSLPPETRAQQANLFNDPDNDYDYLVASDAVGMGLNLSIRRVIFETTQKFDGVDHGTVTIPSIKQIAGRAGRYKTARDAVNAGPSNLTDGTPTDILPPLQSPSTPNVGLITTFEDDDYQLVKQAMTTEVNPIESAGIFPPSNIIRRFASYFPRETPLSYILLRLFDIASVNQCFRLCRISEQIEVADMIQPYNLSIDDRILFLAAPINLRNAGMEQVLAEFASHVADHASAHLLDMKSLKLELLQFDIKHYAGGSAAYLKQAENLHAAITLYLWLSYRFGGVFISQELAFHVKSLVEEKINECLNQVSWEAIKKSQERMKAKAEATQRKREEAQLSRDELSDEATEDIKVILDDSVGDGKLSDQETDDSEVHKEEADTGTPTLPEENVQRVQNRGPLWQHKHQENTPSHLLETHDANHWDESKA